MANTDKKPNLPGPAQKPASQPLGPGSPPQKEQRARGGSDLQDTQHQPAQQDLPMNVGETFSNDADRKSKRRG